MIHLQPLAHDPLLPLRDFLDGSAVLVGDGPGPWEAPTLALLEWTRWGPPHTRPVLMVWERAPGWSAFDVLVPEDLPGSLRRRIGRDLTRFVRECRRGDAGRVLKQWRLLTPPEARVFAEGQLHAD